MKICVIFTGGTIGSHIGDNTGSGVIRPNKAVPYQILEMYIESGDIHVPDTEFITSEPYRILSENLDAAHITLLVHAVSDAIKAHNPDGIIVTHGTDTLQYSAAILSYIFADAALPIMLVSSDYVPEDPRANGPDNFRAAVDFIYERCSDGVFVPFRNSDGIVSIHTAARLLSPITLSADLGSILGQTFATCIYNKDDDRVQGLNHIELNPEYVKLADDRGALPIKPEDFVLTEKASALLWLRAHPGMTYPDPDTLPDLKAVMIEGYHSGTMRTGGALTSWVKGLSDRNIPVYLIGLNDKASEYETVEACRECGIIPLPPCAPIAQYCKLWLAVSCNLEICDIMSASYAGEYL